MRIFSGYGAGDTSRYLWDTVEGNGAVVGGGRANPGRDRVRPRGVVILRSKPKKKKLQIMKYIAKSKSST